MLKLLNVTVWIDPDKPKALDGYRDVLKLLKTHPEVTNDDKMTICLLDLHSRCSNNLVDIYLGLFKVKDISKIKKSMTELLRILLIKIAPTSMKFTLTEHDDEVTLVIQQVQHKDDNPGQGTIVPGTSVIPPTLPKKEETMDNIVERITNFSVASNMMARINTGTPSALICQVQAGTTTSVALSVMVSAKKGSPISKPTGTGTNFGDTQPEDKR